MRHTDDGYLGRGISPDSVSEILLNILVFSLSFLIAYYAISKGGRGYIILAVTDITATIVWAAFAIRRYKKTKR